MASIVDPTQYTLIPYTLYTSLEDKINALLGGEVLYIKRFEQKEGASVLVRLEQKKFTVSQISYDLTFSEDDPRYWTTFNIGINDLSLFTAFKFEEGLFLHTNKYSINDVVTYVSSDGLQDSAIIEEIYVSNLDPNQYAYKLSRDPVGLYAEEDLIKNKYL